MTDFVLVNRRAGLFSDAEKQSSRKSIAGALDVLGSRVRIVADHCPRDPLARRVVTLEARDADIAALRPELGPYAIIEPLVRRHLHRLLPAAHLWTPPSGARPPCAGGNRFTATLNGGGGTFGQAQVLVYLADERGNGAVATTSADASGLVNFSIPAGRHVVAVALMPYAEHWMTVADKPCTGTTIDCQPLAKAGPAGNGWWHDVMGIDTTIENRGEGIRVGVLDSGCGPHANLAHVDPIGSFTGGQYQPGHGATADIGAHGTHVTGIIGARPAESGHYAGMAPACTLLHARIFEGEGPEQGPSNADVVNAIDALSRIHGCDLINMSFGGPEPSLAEQEAIRDAAERGTLCICSAGNGDGSIEYPGAYPDCAAVTAVGLGDWAPSGSFSAGSRPREPGKHASGNLYLAAFSRVAALPGARVACTAPGVGVISTVPRRGDSRDLCMEMDGTSIASAVACGTLAAILGQSGTYKALPKEHSRHLVARLALALSCRTIGLDRKYEGHGLPTGGRQPAEDRRKSSGG
jgi:subtilisin